jgi:hypothetical protein
MPLRNELKDLALEGLAYLVTAVVVVLLLIYTDLGKWPVIILGVGVGIGVVMLIRNRRKQAD